MDALVPDRSPAYRRLDVSILHHLVIDTLLGIKMETHELGLNIEYIKDAGEAVEKNPGRNGRHHFFHEPHEGAGSEGRCSGGRAHAPEGHVLLSQASDRAGGA